MLHPCDRAACGPRRFALSRLPGGPVLPTDCKGTPGGCVSTRIPQRRRDSPPYRAARNEVTRDDGPLRFIGVRCCSFVFIALGTRRPAGPPVPSVTLDDPNPLILAPLACRRGKTWAARPPRSGSLSGRG